MPLWLIGIVVFVVVVLPLASKGYKFYADITGVNKPKSDHH
jgi:hypothetical protein